MYTIEIYTKMYGEYSDQSISYDIGKIKLIKAAGVFPTHSRKLRHKFVSHAADTAHS